MKKRFCCFVNQTKKLFKRSFATENKENRRIVVVGGGCGGLVPFKRSFATENKEKRRVVVVGGGCGGLAPFKRSFATENKENRRVVVVGGGCGGLAVSSKLATRLGAKNVTIIEPSEFHFYQPGWTLVGAGIFNKEQTVRSEKGLIPRGTNWVQDKVTEFEPEKNSVTTSLNGKFSYDVLVVATGVQLDLGGVKGLEEAMGKEGVTTNYSFDFVHNTWPFIQQTKEGNAIFTQPATPVKCGGAPQKICYLAEDYWRKEGVRDKVNVDFYTAAGALFGAPHYSKALKETVCDPRGIGVHVKHNLIEVRPKDKEAIFLNLDTKEELVKKYSFLHVVPPMGPPQFIKQSPLASNETGFVSVDKETTQHTVYKNVFALGDCSSLPTSKTAAAVASQSKITAGNILSFLEGKPLQNKYDGYTGCPIPVTRGKLILAEFDYNLQPKETFGTFFDQRKPSSLLYRLKTDIFPLMYWEYLIRGKWRPGV